MLLGCVLREAGREGRRQEEQTESTQNKRAITLFFLEMILFLLNLTLKRRASLKSDLPRKDNLPALRLTGA